MAEMPVFQTSRLLLRGVTAADIPAWQKNFADYEVIRNLTHLVPWPYPADGAEVFWKSRIVPDIGKDRWFWGIFLRDEPADMIGALELWREGKPENRGFWLARKHWGKGIMTEAVEPVMDYAFGPLGFERLVFANALGNIGSRRVKEKTGARLLRVEPARFVDPKFTEHEIWELKKEDWLKNRLCK